MPRAKNKENLCQHCGRTFMSDRIQACCSKKCASIQKARGKGQGLPQAPKNCLECGKEFTPARPSDEKKFCSRSCVAKNKLKRPEFRNKLYAPEVRERVVACLEKWKETDAGKTERAEASKRMFKMNRDPEIRKKATETRVLRYGNKFPVERGGNGKMSHPQEMLLLALLDLGEQAMPEHCVKTQRKTPYPSVYKIDIALPFRNLAIEVDGKSHLSKEIILMDERKTRLLEELGWKVFRISNEEALRLVSLGSSAVRTWLEGLSNSTT